MPYVIVSIPLTPPNEGTDLYAQTHGEVNDDNDKAVVRVHQVDKDGVVIGGLDGMFPGQSIKLDIGGPPGFTIAFEPLAYSWSEVVVAASWEVKSDERVDVTYDGKVQRRIERGHYATVTNKVAKLQLRRK